jgi:hypothetical protein
MAEKKKFGVDVSIYLYGDALDPLEISSRLGLVPSKSRRKGEQLSPKRPALAKTGIWCVRSKADADVIDLPAAIQALLGKLGPEPPMLTALPGVEHGHLDVFVIRNTDHTGGGTSEFELSAQNIEALKALGLDVRITTDVVSP